MKRIVICDDEPHIVEGLRYLLRSPDREIAIARNGKEAIELVSQAVPDLLIIDVMMPIMNGIEAIAYLREKSECKSLPIVILTAKGQAQDSTMAQELWGAIVMAKPFQPKRLREIVTDLLEGTLSAAQGSK
jgi:two-component system alkaline phosphatase synthesis response regulator PhoP